MSGPSVDEASWGRALAAWERAPMEPAHRLEARKRYDRRAARVAVALLGAASTLALVALVVDPPSDRAESPTWRIVSGISIAVVGLAFALGVRLARPFGSPRLRDHPLGLLGREQRRELREQISGGTPVAPDRLPLARLEARWSIQQSSAVLPQFGLAVAYVGAWIAHRSGFTTSMALAFAALAGTMGLRALRAAGRAHPFLAEHPEPAP